MFDNLSDAIVNVGCHNFQKREQTAQKIIGPWFFEQPDQKRRNQVTEDNMWSGRNAIRYSKDLLIRNAKLWN